MYVVDAWLIYTGATIDALHPKPELDQQQFYCALAEELIERVRPTRSRGGVNRAQRTHTEASLELDNIPILSTPCKRKRNKDGSYTTHRVQKRCRVCYTGRPTTIYSLCEDRDGEQQYLCNPRCGRNCFEEHNELKHT